jgi:hypothetical protein
MFWVGRKDKMKIHEAHAAERKEWRETIEKQFETSNEKTEKFTSVVTELNTLIKQDIASKRP